MAKPKGPRRDDYPPSQATKRRDEALRAALKMPAYPKKQAGQPKREAAPVKK